MVENQFKTTIKTIKSDSGLEFTNNESAMFFQSKEILHQKSCPYTPQQNGVVERKHKYILETTRTFLFQTKLSIKYWGECILTSTYLINRLPSIPLNNKCPYEVLHKHKPLHSHLKSFGCLCYPTIRKLHITKFDPKATPHIFIGYPLGTKGYKVLSFATKKINVSRDVVFHETIFPFAMTSDTTNFPSFPFHLVFPNDSP